MLEPCPLTSVHNRLEDAHTIWHEVLTHYHNPGQFRTFLNAVLEALRNVTFVLQSAKHSIPGFDAWYEGWQARLRSDDIMRWIVEARNAVVKQGDLTTASEARVLVLADYNEPPRSVFDIDPTLPLEAIASQVLEQSHSEWVSDHGTVVVERAWRVAELPNHELLDSLGHAYGVLAELVHSAHIQIGLSPEASTACLLVNQQEREHQSRPNTQWRPACMIATEMARAIAYRISTGQQVIPRARIVQIDDNLGLQSIVDRYGAFPTVEDKNSLNLRGVAEFLFEIAKTMLVKDGYHLTFAFLIDSSLNYSPVALRIDDRADKYLVFRELARQTEIADARAVIVISESWLIPAKDFDPDGSFEESTGHQEVLDLTLVSRDEGSFTWLCPFHRHDSEITLGAITEDKALEAMFLDPIRRMWARQAETSDGSNGPA